MRDDDLLEPFPSSGPTLLQHHRRISSSFARMLDARDTFFFPQHKSTRDINTCPSTTFSSNNNKNSVIDQAFVNAVVDDNDAFRNFQQDLRKSRMVTGAGAQQIMIRSLETRGRTAISDARKLKQEQEEKERELKATTTATTTSRATRAQSITHSLSQIACRASLDGRRLVRQGSDRNRLHNRRTSMHKGSLRDLFRDRRRSSTDSADSDCNVEYSLNEDLDSFQQQIPTTTPNNQHHVRAISDVNLLQTRRLESGHTMEFAVSEKVDSFSGAQDDGKRHIRVSSDITPRTRRTAHAA